MDNLKYKLIKNFLDKSEIDLILQYSHIKHMIDEKPREDPQAPFSSYFYGDPLTDALLLKKQDFCSQQVGKKLFPTYSYWRMYLWDQDLKNHKDRAACEYSFSIHVGGDKKWPFIVDGKNFDLGKGDAVFYKGCEVPHMRKPYDGDWYVQIFLHYVNADGPNKEWLRDKRQHWGIVKN